MSRQHGLGAFGWLFSIELVSETRLCCQQHPNDSKGTSTTRGPPLASGQQLRPVIKSPSRRPFTDDVLVWVFARSCYKICLKHRLSFLHWCIFFPICSDFTGFFRWLLGGEGQLWHVHFGRQRKGYKGQGEGEREKGWCSHDKVTGSIKGHPSIWHGHPLSHHIWKPLDAPLERKREKGAWHVGTRNLAQHRCPELQATSGSLSQHLLAGQAPRGRHCPLGAGEMAVHKAGKILSVSGRD